MRFDTPATTNPIDRGEVIGKPIPRIDGNLWRARIQVYDAPFSLHRADSMTLHVNGRPSYIRGQNGVPTFDDSKRYWYADLPNHGVKVPTYGVTISVLEERADGRLRVGIGRK